MQDCDISDWLIKSGERRKNRKFYTQSRLSFINYSINDSLMIYCILLLDVGDIIALIVSNQLTSHCLLTLDDRVKL